MSRILSMKILDSPSLGAQPFHVISHQSPSKSIPTLCPDNGIPIHSSITHDEPIIRDRRVPLAQPPTLDHAVPFIHRAVSVQMPTWKDMCGIALGEPLVKTVQWSGYSCVIPLSGSQKSRYSGPHLTYTGNLCTI